MRELIVLGTAAQVPTRTRNHNGYLLRWDDQGFLFDPGEGTQRQMTYAGVAVSSVTRICLTHTHGDHCLGLPGVIQRMGADGLGATVPLHYPAQGQPHVDALLAASSHVPSTTVHCMPVTEPGPVAEGVGWTLRAAALDHRVAAVGYRVQEPDGVRMLPDHLAAHGIAGSDVGRIVREGSLRVGDRLVRLDEVSEPRRGQSFAFVMDTRWCDGALRLAADVDMLVCEATFLQRDADLADRYAHLTAHQAATLARESGARRLVLTHFSRRYGDDMSPYAEEAASVFEHVVVAKDLQRIPLPARR